MDCHPIQTNWCPHLCLPTIFTSVHRMPFLAQLSQFILAWDRHQIRWLAYPVAWFLLADIWQVNFSIVLVGVVVLFLKQMKKENQ